MKSEHGERTWRANMNSEHEKRIWRANMESEYPRGLALLSTLFLSKIGVCQGFSNHFASGNGIPASMLTSEA